VADVRARLLLYDEANRVAAGEAVHARIPPHPPTGVRAVSPLPRTGRVGSHEVGGLHTPVGGEGTGGELP
jgi:hypothetical protein